MLISFIFPFFMIIDKVFGFLWYFVKIDFCQIFENYQFAKVYVRKNFSEGPFAKVYVREMQKFREFSHSQKFLFVKVSTPKVVIFPSSKSEITCVTLVHNTKLEMGPNRLRKKKISNFFYRINRHSEKIKVTKSQEYWPGDFKTAQKVSLECASRARPQWNVK